MRSIKNLHKTEDTNTKLSPFLKAGIEKDKNPSNSPEFICSMFGYQDIFQSFLKKKVIRPVKFVNSQQFCLIMLFSSVLLCSFSLQLHCSRVELCSWIHDLKWFCKKWWWSRKIARWQRCSPHNEDWQFLSRSFELRLSFFRYYMISNVFDSFGIRS